jgi:hypothetical protein
MKKTVLLALILMLSLAAFAQDTLPPMNPGNGNGNGNGGNGNGSGQPIAQLVNAEVKFLTALLTLTQAQQDLATVIFTNAETAKAKFAADIPTQEAAVTKAILTDPAGIKKATDAIGADTAGIAAADANAQSAFYQQLIADQKIKYAALLTGEFGPSHGPGNGGPHGHAN